MFPRTSAGARAAVVVIAAASLFAACGSGGNGSSQAGAEPASGALAAFEAKVQADVQRAQGKDPAVAPTDGPKAVPGKKIFLIACTMAAEGCVRPMKAAKAAASAIGWSATLIDTQGDPTKAVSAIQQAIAQHADGIVFNAIDASTVQAAVSEAKAKGIKTVATQSYDADKLYDATIPEQYSGDGYLLGEGMYTQNDKSLHVVEFTDREFTTGIQRQSGFEKFIADCKAAGGDCKILKSQAILAADLATSVPGTAGSVMRSTPDANAVYAPYDAAATFIVQGIQQAGIPSRLIVGGMDGNSQNIEMIRSGGPQTVSVALPMEWEGWHAIDTLNRLFAGQRPVPFPAHRKLIVKDNAPESGGYTGDDPDYAAQYQTVWGVK